MANGHKNLLGPQGQPIFPESRLIVIKQPKNLKIHPQVIQNLGQVTGCSVIVLPMDSEIMMGDIARKELESIHSAIHSILGVIDDAK